MTAPELLMSESQERMMAFVIPTGSKRSSRSPPAGDRRASVGVVKAGNAGEQVEVSTRRDGGRGTGGLTHRRGATLRPSARRAGVDGGSMAKRRVDRPWTSPTTLRCNAGRARTWLVKAWVYEQYDHMLFLNTVVGPGHDATLLRVKGTNRDLRPRPRWQRATLSSRSAVGERPARLRGRDQRRGGRGRAHGLVDNLNFGNPEKPEVMWQFRRDRRRDVGGMRGARDPG